MIEAEQHVGQSMASPYLGWHATAEVLEADARKGLLRVFRTMVEQQQQPRADAMQ